MIARTTISPAEHTANDTLEMRFRAIDSKSACSCNLCEPNPVRSTEYQMLGGTHDLVPSSTSAADCLISGRSRASPGNAAVQNVNAH